MTPAAALAAALSRAWPDAPPARLGVAVSGGGDSLALMVLLAEWGAGRGVAVTAATVDHGLRPEAAAEAAQVARVAAGLGVAHATLRWSGWDGQGNLQAAARAARYRLLAEWAGASGIAAVCLGHTADDQAETVLLNLARGSGVDGLAAMPERRADGGGVVWLRPLLGCRRAALRAELAGRGLAWSEDPGNADARFDRIKARRLLAAPPLPGLGVPRLAATARRMAAARSVLRQAAAVAAERLVQVTPAGIALDRAGYAALPEDTRWRLMAAALMRIGGGARRPRFSALLKTESSLLEGRAATLMGCHCLARGGTLWIGREAAAAAPPTPVPAVWDGRWRIHGPAIGPAGAPVTVGPLTARGLESLPLAAPEGAAPKPLLAALPAVREGETLLAAPALGGPGPWSARLTWDKDAFTAALLSD